MFGIIMVVSRDKKGALFTIIRLSDCKQIHCIGIGGIGLSAIAEILIFSGYDVSDCAEIGRASCRERV